MDAESTPHPHTATELYFGDWANEGHRVLEEEDEYESPAESTPSPRDDDPKGIYTHILEAGTVINGDSNDDGPVSLSLIRALGRGAFSSVWLAENISDPHVDSGACNHDRHAFGDGTAAGRLVAVKVAPRDNHVATLTFEREAEILRVSDNLTGVSYMWHFICFLCRFFLAFFFG